MGVTGKPVLVGMLTGQEAIAAESMTAEQVRDKGCLFYIFKSHCPLGRQFF